MKSTALLISVPAVLAVWCVAEGCGSPQQQLAEDDGESTNVVSNQGTGGSDQTNAPPGTGGGDLTCQGEDPHPSCFPFNTDANCNSTYASTDAECTIDCRVPCGFNEMGLKVCTCVGGKYESCPCARPDTYLGAPSAGFCTQGSGLTDELDETPCTTEWEQCIGRDPVPGTPRGCACMKNAEKGGSLEWFCGSTNNWFALESDDASGPCEGADPDPRCFPLNPDESCNTTNARSGSACTMDCLVGCGFQQMGIKTCVCESGVYTMCPCPKPEGYLGAPTAPTCQVGDGTTEALDDQPCTVEWEQCIGTDMVSGSTPRGCVCMTNRLSGMLQWYCGSTNRWFAPQ